MSPLLEQLASALRALPGVGPKNARRMAYALLLHKRPQAQALADAIGSALVGVGKCQRCRDLTEEGVCALCRSDRRDPGLLCVVESALDVLAFEQTGSYNGLYFVLHGQLSPLDGLGPAELGLDAFAQRLAEGEVREVIVATSPTMEGEATAYYVQQLAEAGGVVVTRLAQGVPMGGSLELLDGATLAQALVNRR